MSDEIKLTSKYQNLKGEFVSMEELTQEEKEKHFKFMLAAEELKKKMFDDLQKYGEVEIKVTKLERTAKVAGNSSDDV